MMQKPHNDLGAIEALLLVALGWRPAPAPVAIAALPFDRLTVAELRHLARVAGLPRTLSRSGRWAQLLEALAAA